jgi:mono/diheme cytochrome c family protein
MNIRATRSPFTNGQGIATTIMSIGTLYLFRLSGKRPQQIIVYRAFLFFTVLGVGVAGHLGASLTHGADYLTEVLPLQRNNPFSGDPNFNLTSFKNNSGSQQREDQIAAINIEVRSIFAHNCYKCHSAEKTKGQLRLDNKELVMRGGKHGEIIQPGHPEKSELIRRLLLPREDEESMPPKGKTLSEKEIAILDLWIKMGALWPAALNEKSIYRDSRISSAQTNSTY